MRNRDRHKILYDVLKSMEKEAQRKTTIMFLSFVSTEQLYGNLKYAKKLKFIKEIDQKFEITKKGLEYIRLYEEIKKMVEFPESNLA